MRDLTSVVVVLATGLVGGSSMAAEARPVATYTFDDGAGAVARDSSGNGNDAKLVGGAKWAKGAYGAAIELNGSDAYLDCGTGDSLQKIASAGTLEVWCYPTAFTAG